MKRSLINALTFSLLLTPLTFGEPTTAPTTPPMAGTFDAYQAEGTAEMKEFKALIPDMALLADSNDQRSALAEKAIPHLKKAIIDLDGMTKTKPAYKWPVIPVHATTQAQLYALGDAETVSMVDSVAKQPGREGMRARRLLLQAHWYMAGQDQAKQKSVVTEVDQLANAQPGDALLAMMITEMGSSAKDPDIKQHMVDLLTNTMDNQTADAGLNKMKNDDKTHSFEGKPMILSGKLPDGKDFTTADWKGKVVLVDFWAAWCGPCKAELPRVQKVYDQYHDKGFEVLGVDNDQSAKAVIGYSAKANLPWPQLFDSDAAAKGAWNPITVSHGIAGIPVMFLIDKKGVCRSVTARDSFEKMIPEMLAE